MSEVVIEVSGVSKLFRVYKERNLTAKERLVYFGREAFETFQALSDVDLAIRRGESVALIGENGSGKSTLLKIISRILTPDSGEVKVRGKVSSLLELGAGFHPDFTGRENIYMNGAILGLSRKEIDKKIDEIISFSELEGFIENPVRSYSSGMYMRLAFSVAVAVDPDILLIDEILAVGDAAFQAKCFSRLRQLRKQNTTIVMVTHDLGSVEKYCDRAIWIDHGHKMADGSPLRVTRDYLQKVFQREPSAENEIDLNCNSQPETGRWGNKSVILSAPVVKVNNVAVQSVRCGDSVSLEFSYAEHRPEDEKTVFGVAIYEAGEDKLLYKTDTQTGTGVKQFNAYSSAGTVLCHIERFNLLPGRYYVDIYCRTVDGTIYDYWQRCAEIEVYSEIGDSGLIRLDHEWEFI